MAPKGSRVSASASGVGDPNFGFVMSVFKNCEQVNLIKPDWNEVAKESGIKHVQNAYVNFMDLPICLSVAPCLCFILSELHLLTGAAVLVPPNSSPSWSITGLSGRETRSNLAMAATW
jgi:hypothetical protein